MGAVLQPRAGAVAAAGEDEVRGTADVDLGGWLVDADRLGVAEAELAAGRRARA